MSTAIKRIGGGYFTLPNRWIDAGYMAKAPGSVTQVYLFLCRWADNSDMQSAQPMQSIAEKCGITEDVARKAVRVLEGWDCLHRESAAGRNAINSWTLLELADQAPDPPKKKKSITPTFYPPNKVLPPPQSTTPLANIGYQPNRELRPGTPISPSEKSGQSPAQKPSLSPAESIYQAYPRKVGKPSALKAISKALKSEPYEKLLEATKAYAAAVANWPEDRKQYIPHPSRWFNDGRFDDDRKEWTRNGKPPPTGLAPIGGAAPWRMPDSVANAKPPVYAKRSQAEMDQDDVIAEELRLNGI